MNHLRMCVFSHTHDFFALMSLKYELDLDILKVYVHTKNGITRSRL